MGLPVQRDLIYLMRGDILQTRYDSFRLRGETQKLEDEFNIAILILLDAMENMKLEGYEPVKELKKHGEI